MLRATALILALLLALPAWAQSADDAAANRLFVEAVQLWNRAERERDTGRRIADLQQVQRNLGRIIEQYPGSPLAVRLVIGEKIGPLSTSLVAETLVPRITGPRNRA